MILSKNRLPEKILDMIKFKAFADEKFNVAEIMISVNDGAENIV